MSLPTRKGQLLLIAMLILAVLMASIPFILTISAHLQRTLTEVKGTWQIFYVAKAAFAQVSSTLESKPDAWDQAIKGDSLSDLGFDGNTRFQGLHNILYTVSCSRETSMLPDQLKVNVNVIMPERSAQKSRLYQAIFSHRTMGIDIPDMAHAPAALYALSNIEVVTGGVEPPQLDVHWGPIICFGALSLQKETGEKEWGHHPRKFCKTGYAPPYEIKDRTDHQEYWVGFPMGDPVVIDEDRYKTAARRQIRDKGMIGKNASGGYLTLPGQTMLFRAAEKPDAPEVTPVFYIDGSAQFESEGIDLGRGAAIISQNATFAGHASDLGMDLHVPERADREYPYLPTGRGFPCQESLGALCPSKQALGDDASVDFRGFLYVKGDLFINEDTVIAGVVRVDGRIKIANGKRLTIFFDDTISRAIFLKGAPILQQIVSQPL